MNLHVASHPENSASCSCSLQRLNAVTIPGNLVSELQGSLSFFDFSIECELSLVSPEGKDLPFLAIHADL